MMNIEFEEDLMKSGWPVFSGCPDLRHGWEDVRIYGTALDVRFYSTVEKKSDVRIYGTIERVRIYGTVEKSPDLRHGWEEGDSGCPDLRHDWVWMSGY